MDEKNEIINRNLFMVYVLLIYRLQETKVSKFSKLKSLRNVILPVIAQSVKIN